MESKPVDEDKKLKEIIYETVCKCPVCQSEIVKKSIRDSRNRMVHIDFDLYACYEYVNPIYYEIVACSKCGYAQLKRSKKVLTLAEIKLIQEAISYQYLGYDYKKYYTRDDAIYMHKLALLNAQVRNATEGEKGYIMMKLAWLYREAGNKEEEDRFIQKTRNSFIKAYQTEEMPIFELEEDVVVYLVAALSYQMKEYKEAKKWLTHIAIKRQINDRLRIRIFDLNRMIKMQEAKEQEEQIKE